MIFGNHSKESGGYFINSVEQVMVYEQGTGLSKYSVCVCVQSWSVVSDSLGPQVL